ncbi:unnamed protein product [Moneuplotes crassus]|uniref:ATP-dependent RNA helicase n=2 Tax=Euplotes crassus TaxID=5936 RepID=A0AAD1X612_EUPCR|nr:unnamed protein product [Moneuplotes crassus]
METTTSLSPDKLKYSKWKQVDMKISKEIVNHLRKDMNFNKITKVQRETIPLFAKNKDVCVKACTGSGKTLAYLVSALQIILNSEYNSENRPKKYELLTLILVPARELAKQVGIVLDQLLTKFEWLKGYCCIGGNKISEDIDSFQEKGANILIGTVGRIWDFIDRGVIKLKTVKVLVIDEADLFFQQGNQIKLNQIMDKIPRERRTGLFSATMSDAVQGLARIGMRNPYYIEIFSYKEKTLRNNCEPFAIESLREEYARTEDFEERSLRMKIEETKNEIVKNVNEIPSTLKNYFLVVGNQDEKLKNLLEFIKQKEEKQKYMIFFATCASVEYYSYILYHLFKKFSIPGRKILKLHRKIKQTQRSKVYQTFLKMDNGILLTTDVSARGLDIPDIDWIIQFDPPQDTDQYIHRIGRTARAGKEGESLILLQTHEQAYVQFLKSRKVDISEIKLETEFDNKSITELCKGLMKKDKDLIDKSRNGFVSFFRYYKEHELKFIMDFKQLDIAAVANAFSLLRMPRIKEILGKKTKKFVNEKIDIDSIPYLNKNKKMQKEKMKEVLDEKKEKKREEKLKRKEIAEKQREEKNKVTRAEKKRRRKELEVQDWDDLQREDRIYKKYKKGRITKEEYEQMLLDD